MIRRPEPTMNRRQAFASTAALPLAAGLAASATTARASADMLGTDFPKVNRFRLGSFEVTTILAGTRTVPDPHTIFGMNASDDDFATVSEENFIPTDKAQFFFTPTVVNTGSELILFDTGLDPAGITDALKAAGYAPDQIDIVVITHMHGDHIGGLMGDGGETFANADYITGRVEQEHWSQSGNETYEAKVAPINDKFSLLDGGGEVAAGITAVEAFGHTPGHMAYMIESDGAQLMLIADTANHYVWSIGYPDWEVKFDMDKAMAAETRRTLFGRLAEDKIPFIGYHMPFPALGFVTAEGDGFRYVPASYQMKMG